MTDRMGEAEKFYKERRQCYDSGVQCCLECTKEFFYSRKCERQQEKEMDEKLDRIVTAWGKRVFGH